MNNDPLVTRALPNSIWEQIPNSWIEWDIALQKSIASDNPDSAALKYIDFFTSKPLGIFFSFSLVIGLLILKKNSSWKYILSVSGLCLVLSGISDACSSGLKVLFGRLKPHVTFYNPDVLPALSFPSNHATNTSFIFFLLCFAHFNTLKKDLLTWTIFGLLTAGIGYSRILLGQHHPLDVIFGWFFGACLAAIFQRVFVKLKDTFPIR